MICNLRKNCKFPGDDYKHMRERVKSSAGVRRSGTYYGFFKRQYNGGRVFLKNKITFFSKKCVPAVEFNCCVSDEHAFDFMSGRDFLLLGVCQ